MMIEDRMLQAKEADIATEGRPSCRPSMSHPKTAPGQGASPPSAASASRPSAAQTQTGIGLRGLGAAGQEFPTIDATTIKDIPGIAERASTLSLAISTEPERPRAGPPPFAPSSPPPPRRRRPLPRLGQGVSVLRSNGASIDDCSQEQKSSWRYTHTYDI